MKPAALAVLTLLVIAALGFAAALLGGYLPQPWSQSPVASFRSPTGAVPATPQRPGNAEAGYRALVNAPYVSCGMPYEAYRRVSPATPPSDLLPGRIGRNAELPYYLTAHTNQDGVEVVSTNCLVCHAGQINGEVVVGLGNAFADFTGDPRNLATQAGSYVRGQAQTAAWQRWADRIDGIAPYIRTDTVGVNPATNLTWALMAHRDPETMAWSRTPLLDPPPSSPVPLKVPPWWWMQKKNAMFYTTIGRGDHSRFMLFASMLCADTVEELEAIDKYAPDIRAYLESLRPPSYPFEIDKARAAEGQSVYESNCSRCHGSYGESATYPNLVVPLDVVGTDPAYAQSATDGSLDRFYRWVERSPYGETVQTAPSAGYIASPLDGIWAAAPYLHNGSVPSLRSLLDSRLRPAFWRHAEPPAYDPAALGWRHEVLAEGKADFNNAQEKTRVYDTTLPGYGNGGHLFGDTLTEGEREALLEYLKTL
jgi:mono/diheme cytochrome c family protein